MHVSDAAQIIAPGVPIANLAVSLEWKALNWERCVCPAVVGKANKKAHDDEPLGGRRTLHIDTAGHCGALVAFVRGPPSSHADLKCRRRFGWTTIF